MKTNVSFKYFADYCFRELFVDSKLPQASLHLILKKFLVTLRPFPLLEPEVRAIKFQKQHKICLT